MRHLKLIVFVLTFVIFLCGCGNASQRSTETQTKQEAVPSSSEDTIYNIPENFVNGYVKGEHKKYASDPEDNGLRGQKVYVTGVLTYVHTVTLDNGQQMFDCYVVDEQSKRWAFMLDLDIVSVINKYQKLEGHPVCIRGTYIDYSEAYGNPWVVTDRIFDQSSGAITVSAAFMDYQYEPEIETQPETTPQTTAETEPQTEPEPETEANVEYRSPWVTNTKSMRLREQGRIGDVIVGLSHVKKMSYLPTTLSKEEVTAGNEVVIGFFEFFNPTDKEVKIRPEQIECYADGIQVGDVETYIKVKVDGIAQIYDAVLAPGTQAVSCQDFEVPKGWSQLKFFYEDDCVWTVAREDVSEESYTFDPMITVTLAREETKEEETILSDKYDLVFCGTRYYSEKVLGKTQNYAVFLFRIDNKGSETLDLQYVGYRMNAYQNNYLLDDATYTLDEKIDGYRNIFDVDEVKASMSAKVYIAFEVEKKSGSLCLMYDDGYIVDGAKATVYVNEK